jgi:hypothetical protein
MFTLLVKKFNTQPFNERERGSSVFSVSKKKKIRLKKK